MTTSTRVAAAIPLVALANVFAFAAVVRLKMGGWPDPGSVPQPLFAWDVIATVALLAIWASTPVALVVAGVAALLKYPKARNTSLAFALTAFLVYGYAFIDLGGILSWFFD